MHHSADTNLSHRHARNRTRGNTIVLVTAILVLLVVIATAFVSRTRSVRVTSAAQQSAAGRDGRGESIGVDVAREIAGALFPKPVSGNYNLTTGGATLSPATDPFFRLDTSVTPNVFIASSSVPRAAAPLNAVRYGIDRDLFPPSISANDAPGDGYPDFGYNIAPYEVKPWTNWPDDFTLAGGDSPWPAGRGVGNLLGQLADVNGRPIGDANPYGNPGFGDSRWLRSTEPERVEQFTAGSGKRYFTFSHWSHLSWLPTANNAWRVVADIQNIDLNTVDHLDENVIPTFAEATRFNGSFATAVPYEQWLPGVQPNFNVNPSPAQPFILAFEERRNNWFNPFNTSPNYAGSYRDPNLVLPNFFQLKALGIPSDEFRAGTSRNVVSRTFADTDGDGFTDSFWFAGPTNLDRGIKTIVGVSIVDNSALINANVATKFSFDTTAGHTPADLALVTSLDEWQGPNRGTHVGFLDGPLSNDDPNTPVPPFDPPYDQPTKLTQFAPTFRWIPRSPASEDVPLLSVMPAQVFYDRSAFGDEGNRSLSFLQAIGLRTPNNLWEIGTPAYPLVDGSMPANPNRQGIFESSMERLSYFKLVGLNPQQPMFGMTPFDASDEFELRAYHGNNLPFVLSRFEQAINPYTTLYPTDERYAYQFLRSAPSREETTESLDQLDAPHLLIDNRRKMTLFNGARNDIAPPYLWPSPFYDANTNYRDFFGEITAADEADEIARPSLYAERNYLAYELGKRKIDLRQQMYFERNTDTDPELEIVLDRVDLLNWRARMIRLLDRTMVRSYLDGATNQYIFESYWGLGVDAKERTQAMIASYVANLEAAMDEPQINVVLTNVIGAETPDSILNNATNPGIVAYPPRADATGAQILNLGMEKQPFISEVFFGLVYPKTYLKGSDLILLNAAYVNDIREDQREDYPVVGDSLPTVGSPPQINNAISIGQQEGFVSDLSKPVPIIAIQIANPYDTPLSLSEFRVGFYGQYYQPLSVSYGPSVELPPATLGRPSTATLYYVGTPFETPPSPLPRTWNQNLFPISGAGAASAITTQNNEFRAAILDFLDLEADIVDEDNDGILEYTTLYDSNGNGTNFDPLDRSLVFRVPAGNSSWMPASGASVTTRLASIKASNGPSVEIQRRIGPGSNATWVTVDRLENPDAPNSNQLYTNNTFHEVVEQELLTRNVPPKHEVVVDINRAQISVNGIELGVDEDFFFTWVRVARPWAIDVDTWQTSAPNLEHIIDGDVNVKPEVAQGLRRISSDELSPRFVFSATTAPQFPTQEQKVWIDGSKVGNDINGSTIKWERSANMEFGDTPTGASPPPGFSIPATYATTTDNTPGDRTDPDGAYGSDNFWATMVAHDPFGRIYKGKPSTFANVLFFNPDATDTTRTALYSDLTGQSMPFLPKLGLNNGDAGSEVYRQPWHRDVDYNGETIEFIIGGKGYTPRAQPGIPGGAQLPDLVRFQAIDALNIPFQMTQRDSDFEQIGEVLDVFLWGHIIDPMASYTTTRTFSETLVETRTDALYYPGPAGPFLNRLDFSTTRVLAKNYELDDAGQLAPGAWSSQWTPALPAGLAFLDGLTIDNFGRRNPDRDAPNASVGFGTIEQDELDALERERYRLAHGLLGRSTPGLININTALLETMQTLPLAYCVPATDSFPLPSPNGRAPQLRFPQAALAYRNGQFVGFNGGFPSVLQPTIPAYSAPAYGDRGLFQKQLSNSALAGMFPDPTLVPNSWGRYFEGMRAERGFATSAELNLLLRTRRTGPVAGLTEEGTWNSYSIRGFGLDLYDRNPLVASATGLTDDDYAAAVDPGDFLDINTRYAFGTDRTRARASQLPTEIAAELALLQGVPVADFLARRTKNEEPARDATSLNMLYKGISNLVTTRSDVFTVYLRVRQVKQNPTTGVWDGSNSESIVDDSRYVMCVDRSECNNPSDEPKILYFQKCPW